MPLPFFTSAVVAGLVRETPDHQLMILAVLLLWVRQYGSTAWREYCEALLPPVRELSCLLCYTPGELSTLQLPHMVVSGRQAGRRGRPQPQPRI